MNRVPELTATVVARVYLGVQAVAGALWWLSVFTVDGVDDATLGNWDPAIVVGPDVLLFVGGSALAAVTFGGRSDRWRTVGRVAAVVTAVWTLLVTIALTLHGLLDRVAGAGVVLMAAASIGTVLAVTQLWFGRVPTAWFFLGPFSFRVAGEGSRSHHVRRSVAQLVVFWSFFFGLVPAVFVAIERRLRIEWAVLDDCAVGMIAIVVLALASALGLWSCLTMAVIGQGTPLPAETARELVVSGPYRLVRNPMAVAGALQTAAVGLIAGSWTVVVIAAIGAVAWNILIRPTEEADLAARFGESYNTYAAAVRCWIPRLTGSSSTRDVCHPAGDA